MSLLPAVIQAEYRGGHAIHLQFDDGVQGTVDFRQWLDGPVFEPLLDLAYFQRFFLDGSTVLAERGRHRTGNAA